MKVRYQENSNTRNFYLLILQTLSSLSLTEAERKEMDRLNIMRSNEIFVQVPYELYELKSERTYSHQSFDFNLRSSDKDLAEWVTKVRNTFYKELTNFVITDNLGVKSSFDGYSLFCEKTDGELQNYYNEINGCYIKGKGLFSSGVFTSAVRVEKPLGYPDYSSRINLFIIYDHEQLFIPLKFNIRKDEIMKYTNFTVERKE